MINNFNLLKSRKNLLISLFIDLVILLYPFSANIFIDIQRPNLFFLSPLILIFLTTSYVIGRYSFIKFKNLSIIKYLFKSIISLLLVLSLIYLFYLFGFISKSILEIFSYFTIEKACFSFALQFLFFKILSYRIGETYELWFFVGNNITFEKINKEYSNKYNLIINKLDELDILIAKKEYKFEGLIYEDAENKSLFRKELTLRNLQRIKEFKLIEWCEKHIYRFPIDFIKDKDLNYNFPIYSAQTRLKFISDITLSIILLIISIPIFLLVSLIIKIEDGGPILYSQMRVGKNGKIFKLWKFRSMKINSEEEGPKWSQKNDTRITKVGTILRMSRIDELPQLFCVLKGDMSLIGPRPERPEIELTLEKEINYYSYRKLFKPGLSGWAQVNYPYGASIQDSKVKLSYDIFYIENFSTLLDFIIFFKTIKLVLNLKGSKPNT